MGRSEKEANWGWGSGGRKKEKMIDADTRKKDRENIRQND